VQAARGELPRLVRAHHAAGRWAEQEHVRFAVVEAAAHRLGHDLVAVDHLSGQLGLVASEELGFVGQRRLPEGPVVLRGRLDHLRGALEERRPLPHEIERRGIPDAPHAFHAT